MSLKLYSVPVNPPEAMYCAGGWAVIRANDAEHAKALLKEQVPWVFIDGEPEELLDNGDANVLFVETYQE